MPATTDIKIDPATNTLMRQGIKGVINPVDKNALEEGLRLKDKHGGKVTVITMGPPQAEESLREAVSLGADDVILLSDRAFAGSDTLATSYVLSRAVAKAGSCDLIICGRQTVDGDTGQVGPQVAQMLGMSFISYVSRIEDVAQQTMRAEREVDEGREVVETSLPAVISVVKEINTLRVPSLRGMMRAKTAKVTTWTAKDLDADPARIGISGSPTCVVKVFSPERAHHAEMLHGSPEEQAQRLVERLKGMI